ncbi:PH domain-containing protein [Halorientalis litorea]|uniref:PH domain-containing protein n=1 Tax=Halorientalis litorea TaxID=2931977 RepID=UPI001FF433AC|nr:PH domain-containing protein [Halorientalis litorea]
MRLHPLSALVRGIQRGLVVGSVAFFLTSMSNFLVPDSTDTVGLIFVLAPLGFLLGAGYQVAYYYRFEYDLTPDTLDIAAGVVGRKEREIPYRRVQNVDITESIFHRIVGVAVVRVETAGGSETEATLNFVAADEARRVQSEIRDRRAAAQGETRAADEPDTAAATPETDADAPRRDTTPTEIFELDESELVVLSLASFRRATLFLVAVGFPLVQDRLFGFAASVTGIGTDVESITGTPDLLLLTGLVAVAIGAVGTWALSAAVTFSEYYGFRLGRQGEDLVYERGLLQRYSGSIPTDKVQTLTIKENLVMRALGYAGLAVETAGYSPGQNSGQGGSQSAVPLTRRARALELARDIEPFDTLSFTRPPKIARRRYAVRYLLAVLAIAGVFAAARSFVGNFSLWFTPLLLVPVVPVAAHYKWKHRGYHVGEDYFVVRDGFWRQTTRVVPYYRLQTAIRSRTVFQRRLGLAHLTADTATSSTFGQRDATAYDIDAEDAQRSFETIRERLQAHLGAEPVGQSE